VMRSKLQKMVKRLNKTEKFTCLLFPISQATMAKHLLRSIYRLYIIMESGLQLINLE
jgi:hypothetical protein